MGDHRSMKTSPPHQRRFWGMSTAVVISDVVTKELARRLLVPERVPHEVVGDVVRLSLSYNPGAAFGLSVGAYSRWFFTALASVILVVLWRMYRDTPPGQRLRVIALALVAGGAVGNVINRLWSERGVVDFIDVGVGTLRWPTFNVADMGISIGAVLLVFAFPAAEPRDPEQRAADGRGPGTRPTTQSAADDRTPG